MLVDHLANYRRALPLGLIFAGVSIAAVVIFIVYAAKWNELSLKYAYQMVESTMLIKSQEEDKSSTSKEDGIEQNK